VLRGALLALALLLAACGSLPTRPGAGPITDLPDDVAAVSATSLSARYSIQAVRLDITDRVWRVIASNYYDPQLNGVNWAAVRHRARARAAAALTDEEFYAALKDMAAALGDSHTIVLTPRETVDRRRFISTRLGMQLTFVEGQVVVCEIEPGSPAALAGVSVGDVLVAVAGRRIDRAFVADALTNPQFARSDVLAGDGPEALPDEPQERARVRVLRAVRRELRRAGPARSEGPALDFVRADGAPLHAQLLPTALPRPPVAALHWLDGGVAVIRMTRFVPELRPALEAALDEAARARAVIVDLRGNGGGSVEMFNWFTGQFLAEEHLAVRTLRRNRPDGDGQRVSDEYVGPDAFAPRQRALLQPLAVLIDGRTGSAAELAAVVLAEQRSALLVGEPSCGCVVGVPIEYVLPDGGGVRVAETGFVTARGVRLEGAPTMPAVRVVPALADLRSGRDPVLEEAHRRMMKASAR
jgi:carboxyl-terminal processing protease